ncbi:B-cell lymphoma 3 protein [Solea senegalensis]|uniref:B-cell lymphoma 3 protein n=1 Tax=Solea senegalensis TaxID=28829 RepID=A0AAV6PET0_SOLSE|nr:B-cell lymphoma 3 protein homolog [Solea senegalensis]KAG7457247.1 B-cell lymphoma 3 protein [Solea senegalensis]
MPRIMTMNGDQQQQHSVATAPLDLRTTNRERRSPECSGSQRSRQQERSPAHTTGTQSLETHGATVRRSAPGLEHGAAARKRPADTSSLKLPFRKRPWIPVEPDTRTQSQTQTQSQTRTQTETQPSPPPESGHRVSPVIVGHTDLTHRDSLERPVDENRLSAATLTPRRTEETELSADRRLLRRLHPVNYGHYPAYYLPPVGDMNHPLIQQTDNLLAGIALATHQDEDGDTALHIAVVQGELAVVCTLIHLLLLAAKSVDVYNNLRQTPLHLAVITQQPDMVGVLLRAGADPTALDRHGQTALHLCCEYHQRECLSVVLSRSSSPTCLEIRNYEGLSPLHLAVLRGRKDLARMLLDAGADINAMDIKSGQSPLMHAVESNNADMVHFLIENGSDVNSQSYSGNTALHGACGRDQADTVRLLLKSGADSSLKNYHNDTPVMVAKSRKIADVLRGRGSKYIRLQDQHCVSVSPHGSNLSENGSSSPSQSRGCSPLTSPHTPHRSTSHSPKTPSVPVFPSY